eukprot:2395303-Lingulodinium_polyedra.AAC.1
MAGGTGSQPEPNNGMTGHSPNERKQSDKRIGVREVGPAYRPRPKRGSDNVEHYAQNNGAMQGKSIQRTAQCAQWTFPRLQVLFQAETGPEQSGEYARARVERSSDRGSIRRSGGGGGIRRVVEELFARAVSILRPYRHIVESEQDGVYSNSDDRSRAIGIPTACCESGLDKGRGGD